jgi:hypothetical protein
MKLLLALLALTATSACQRLETTIEKGVDRALSQGQSAGMVPIGRLLNHVNGPICIVLGEVNDVNFSAAVPVELRDRIAHQLDAGLDGHMSVKVHLFDGEGRRTDAMSMHWRNPRVFIDPPDAQTDLDACFAPDDALLVRGGEPPSLTVISFGLLNTDAVR